jgi:hypothetical protein
MLSGSAGERDLYSVGILVTNMPIVCKHKIFFWGFVLGKLSLVYLLRKCNHHNKTDTAGFVGGQR